MGKPATLVRGSKGVDLFYNAKRMMREEAMPLPVRGPLFGAGAIHGTDDEVHQARKDNFIKVVYDDAQVERFKPLIEDEMRKVVETWGRREGNVYDDTVVRPCASGLATAARTANSSTPSWPESSCRTPSVPRSP